MNIYSLAAPHPTYSKNGINEIQIQIKAGKYKRPKEASPLKKLS